MNYDVTERGQLDQFTTSITHTNVQGIGAEEFRFPRINYGVIWRGQLKLFQKMN